VLATSGFGGERIRCAARCLSWPCPDGQARPDSAFVRHCSFEHATRALPRVRRRLPTLRALGLEEPFPFRPTSDVLCRLAGTVATTPTVTPADLARSGASSEQAPNQLRHEPLDRLGQGCAFAPRIRGNDAHNPERLGLYRSQLMTQSAEAPRSGVATRNEALSTPFHPAISARPRQGPLGRHRARSDPDPRSRLNEQTRLRTFTDQRCFRSTHASHVVKDEHPSSA
jgi:hypothetical protein